MVAGLALTVGGAAAGAASPARPRVDVAEVTGRLDPVEVDFVKQALRKAEDGRATVLVIQLNSPGALVSRGQLDVLTFEVAHAGVPVAVWVGPSGAIAYGGAAELVRAAHVAGVAPGAHIGRATLRQDRELGLGGVLGSEQARARQLVALTSPTLGAFVNDLSGRQVAGRTLDLPTKVVQVAGRPQRQPQYEVSFEKPALLPRLLHTVASPAVAYLLLVIGLLLLVFEFFTAGIGIAGACGAGAVVLAGYGLAVLPTRPLALGLVAIAVFGYAIDVQTGVPRAWTAIGTVALLAGSLDFYRGLSVGIAPLVVAIVGTPLFMIGGMTGVVRSRFSTPTVGRASMIGEEGVAVGAVNPEGTVRVRGALWRARTSRVTPIPGGDGVRVAGIDGLLLEVEPLEGAVGDAAR